MIAVYLHPCNTLCYRSSSYQGGHSGASTYREKGLGHCNLLMFTIILKYLVRQQLEADIERLTSDKADLLTRLQCFEKDLKTANECECPCARSMQLSVISLCLVLIMREKAVSGMLATTSRGDGGVKETIRQKSVSDIAVQTTTEEGQVPLPVSGANS